MTRNAISPEPSSFHWTGNSTVHDALQLMFFPNSPSDILAITVIRKDNIEGEVIYDGQVHRLYTESSNRHILEMPCKGWDTMMPSNSVLQTLFV